MICLLGREERYMNRRTSQLSKMVPLTMHVPHFFSSKRVRKPCHVFRIFVSTSSYCESQSKDSAIHVCFTCSQSIKLGELVSVLKQGAHEHMIGSFGLIESGQTESMEKT
jgi:hypothetical protein